MSDTRRGRGGANYESVVRLLQVTEERVAFPAMLLHVPSRGVASTRCMKVLSRLVRIHLNHFIDSMRINFIRIFVSLHH